MGAPTTRQTNLPAILPRPVTTQQQQQVKAQDPKSQRPVRNALANAGRLIMEQPPGEMQTPLRKQLSELRVPKFLSKL